MSIYANIKPTASVKIKHKSSAEGEIQIEYTFCFFKIKFFHKKEKNLKNTYAFLRFLKNNNQIKNNRLST